MVKPVNTRTDVNRDGVVDVDDLVLVAVNFGKSFAAFEIFKVFAEYPVRLMKINLLIR